MVRPRPPGVQRRQSAGRLIETGAYPDITAEEESDPIGAYNIPDEVEEMGGGPQREIGAGPTMTMFWAL